MESWALALVIIAAVFASYFVLKNVLKTWAVGAYRRILKNPATECDIDGFVGYEKNPVSALKCVLAHKIQIGNRKASLDPISLESVESPHVAGLRVSRKLGTDVSTDEDGSTSPAISIDQLISESEKTPIVIATIRMGFGHHRLAYSTASWAIQTGHPTIFHDLLSIKSAESELIQSTDALYSKFSRMASEFGGPVEKMWGAAMMQGDADALRIAAATAAHLLPLLIGYPKDIPIITTHQLCALTASAAGFTNVVNLVVDNWPQWFLTVPKTLNIVQGPVNYECFLKMGVKPEELKWAGHWCPADMVNNIDLDCKRRINRAVNKKPIRMLIPVGGAGAQRKFIIKFLRALAPYVKEGKVQLFLNAGDHEHMKTAFLQVLDECSLDFETVENTAGVRNFQQRLLTEKNEPIKDVTLFAFDEYFPAVATTDILCRVADVLSCKPSELAFYCVPKLHLRRVGDHEAASAKRSSELGDGTLEAREVGDALAYLDLFMSSPDMLRSMNEAIMNNNKIEIYHGCRKAVELVLKGVKK